MNSQYLNVRSEPVTPGFSFVGAFRSATQRNQEADEDEEYGNQYMSFQGEDAAFQEGYHSSLPASFGDALRSSIPGFLKGSAREAAPSNPKGLLRSMTPSFLRNDEEDDMTNTCCPNLGLKQRIFGCACCLILGQLVQFLSFGSMAGVLLGHPGKFAFMYTFGNFVMLTASFFFSGPQAQWKKIMAKDRAKTSFAYFSTMILTLTMVFAHPFFGRPLIIMLLVVVQWCALVWYVLSFVPYGHSFGRRVVRTVGSWVCKS